MIADADDLVVGPWGAWFRGRRFPCAIGRGGISVEKREGDGRTPAGRWRLVGGMWRADRMARPDGPALTPAGPRDIWSDDPADPFYNRLGRRGSRAFSCERMRRGDGLYDLVLFSDWNEAGVPGAGSAIFVHCWRGPRRPTAGCIAFARRDLRWIWARWTARSRVVVQAGWRSPKMAEPTRT